MSDVDHVSVTENATVVRDPVTGERQQVIERTVTERRDSSWALWVAGIAVFIAALVLALIVMNRNPAETDADVLAAQAEAEAARLQAEQATMDANQARMDAAVNGLTSNNAAGNAAAASAAAAEAAAARAAAAAESARGSPPVVVHSPSPSTATESTGGSEEVPPQ